MKVFRCLSRGAIVPLGLAIVLRAGQCLGQTVDPAQAVTLFERGRAALAKQDYEGACVAFAESLKLDARVGTLLNLADCEEHLGRLAFAYAHWQQAVDRAKASGDDRIGFLNKRFSALDRRVPKLTIARGPHTPADAVIRRDQIELGEASAGQEVPIDPGHHVIEASADGFVTKRYAVDLDEGAHKSITVDLDELAPSSPLAPVVSTQGVAVTHAGSWTTRKTLALAAGGLGVVGFGVGVVAAVTAVAKKTDVTATPNCTSTGACDKPTALAQWNASRDAARTAATISMAASVAGGIALVTGVVLWFTPTAKPAVSARAELGIGPRSLELRGEW